MNGGYVYLPKDITEKIFNNLDEPKTFEYKNAYNILSEYAKTEKPLLLLFDNLGAKYVVPATVFYSSIGKIVRITLSLAPTTVVTARGDNPDQITTEKYKETI